MKLTDGKFLDGSFEKFGYLVVAKAGHFIKNIRDDKDNYLGDDMDDNHNGEDIILYKDSSHRDGYGTDIMTNCWYVTQHFSCHIFESEYEALKVFDRYLKHCNELIAQHQKFKHREPYKREDLFVKVIKCRGQTSLEIIE